MANRAECQICGGSYAVTASGNIHRHGFKRPGFGYITGGCPGAGHKPYPATDALADHLRLVERSREWIEERLNELSYEEPDRVLCRVREPNPHGGWARPRTLTKERYLTVHEYEAARDEHSVEEPTWRNAVARELAQRDNELIQVKREQVLTRERIRRASENRTTHNEEQR